MSTCRVAALQLCASADRDATLRRARTLVERAATEGARFVATPENTDLIGPRQAKIAGAEPLDGPWVSGFRNDAARLGIWLLIGSFAERIEGETRVHNTSVLLSPAGDIAGVYRKIHLFDAAPPDGPPYRESDVVKPGDTPTVVRTPFGVLGLSICYDLRFPELFRSLSASGATILCVPSAFTVPTGRAHWETLLRARAIENLSWVIAPAQVGRHGADRESWGHSLVVDPWGQVVADGGGETEGVVFATIDDKRLQSAREMIPALSSRRLHERS